MNLPALLREQGINTLPDTDRYKFRFNVRSASSNQLYMVSYDDAPNAGWWTCSCRGNIAHGQCKHLTSMGLKGRQFGHQKLSDYTDLKGLNA